MTYSALDIRHYVKDNIVKLAHVTNGSNGRWLFKNINEELMYADHTSWIYFIVVNNIIFKVGETGNPLGIRKRGSDQPISSSRCRMGRLASYYDGKGRDTDITIRKQLAQAIKDKKVSIWVRKCDIIDTKIKVGNRPTVLKTSLHKDLEMKYLDYIYYNIGHYPTLNKGRA